jgi:hypothetical protein
MDMELSGTAGAFIALVVGTWLLFVAGVGVSAGRGKGGVGSIAWKPALSAGLVTAIWLGFAGAMAGTGLLRNYDALPPPMLRVLLPGLVLVLAAAFSPFEARLADGLGWGALIGVQAFRILVELLLSTLFQEGRIPVEMTFHGANFDILTGVSAIAVAWLAVRGRIGTWVIWVWNLAGLALLGNIVTISVLAMPGRLHLASIDPVNTLVFGWPYVWLPTWLVLIALLGHLLVFRKLMRSHGD